MTQDNLFGSGIFSYHRHRNQNSIDFDWDGLCHPPQIRPIAIRSDHHPVGTFSPDIQLTGDFFTHHTDHRFTINDQGKLVHIYLAECNWRGPGIQELGVSGGIIQCGEASVVSDRNFRWCSWGPGSNQFIIVN